MNDQNNVGKEQEMREMVMNHLENYQANERRIEVLKFEVSHPAQVSSDDIIDSMSFTHGEGGLPGSNYISDKTLFIALNYQDRMEHINLSALNEVKTLLRSLEWQQERLRHYISLLDANEAEIIRLSFMEGLQSHEVGAKLGITARTVRTRRNQAIDHLCEMYLYAAELQQNK